MLCGETTKGFKFELDEEALDDWELLSLLQEIDNGNELAIIPASKLLLGEKQLNDLKEFLRGENGRVKMTEMVIELTEIMNSPKETKNY